MIVYNSSKIKILVATVITANITIIANRNFEMVECQEAEQKQKNFTLIKNKFQRWHVTIQLIMSIYCIDINILN